MRTGFAIGSEDFELLFDGAAEVEADELSVERNHVAHDEDGLVIELNRGEDWIGAGSGCRRRGKRVGARRFAWEEEGIVGVVDVEEVALVGDESVVAELLVEGKGDSLGLVVFEKCDESFFAALEVRLFPLQESVLQRAEGDEAEEHKAGEGHEQVQEHELCAY